MRSNPEGSPSPLSSPPLPPGQKLHSATLGSRGRFHCENSHLPGAPLRTRACSSVKWPLKVLSIGHRFGAGQGWGRG